SPLVISGNLIEGIGGSVNAVWDSGIHVRANLLTGETPPPPNGCNPTFTEMTASALITGNVIRGISKGDGINLAQADVTVEGNYVERAKNWGISYYEDLSGATPAPH